MHDLVENKGGDAFALPLGQDADQQQFDAVVAAKSLEDVIPTEGQEVSAGFLQGGAHVRDGYSEGDHVAVLVLHAADIVGMDDVHEFGGVEFLLAGSEGDEVFQRAVRLVQDVEDLGDVPPDGPFAAQVGYREFVALLDDGGKAADLFRDLFRDDHFLFHPFGAVLQPAGQQVAFVVRVVVQGGGVGEFLEAFGEQGGFVQVAETYRTFHVFHVVFASPAGGVVEQGAGDFGIVLEVEPTEAEFALAEQFVFTPVDDQGQASDDASLLAGNDELHLAEFQRGVVRRVEGLHLVRNERGYPVSAAFVEFEGEQHEGFECVFVVYFCDLYHCFISLFFHQNGYARANWNVARLMPFLNRTHRWPSGWEGSTVCSPMSRRATKNWKS